MDIKELREIWINEEEQAHIHGWDFSHISGRFEEEANLPWNYKEIIKTNLNETDELLDIDTGGGEFLLSLNHPLIHTAATEGYAPNVKLCREKLLPLGIDFKEMSDHSKIPYGNERFDVVINRHGKYDISELKRVLKPGGIFITQQVGEDNDRDFVEFLLPGTPKSFHGLNLKEQKLLFEKAGFEILEAEECFRSIKFYDVGALVWFAHIIEWEFPNFSVDRCFEKLLMLQKILDKNGVIEGSIHRYLIMAKK